MVMLVAGSFANQPGAHLVVSSAVPSNSSSNDRDQGLPFALLGPGPGALAPLEKGRTLLPLEEVEELEEVDVFEELDELEEADVLEVEWLEELPPVLWLTAEPEAELDPDVA